MQISRHWRLNANRYRLEGYSLDGVKSLQARLLSQPSSGLIFHSGPGKEGFLPRGERGERNERDEGLASSLTIEPILAEPMISALAGDQNGS